MIPLRLLFRSRWIALAWAASICCTAASFAGHQHRPAQVNAAESADDSLAQTAALAAEDDR